ncbi:MAG TPA: GerMN domain-containing protein [Candidatus Omnitrophota bacterium]|nr:GerMN domain-containing protein [Candidatus Omnitrophota bacterium]
MKRSKKAAPLWWVLIGAIVLCAVAFYFIKTTEPPSIRIYFLKGEKLTEVKRPLRPDKNELELAAAELMAGPNAEERKNEVFSEIPREAKIMKVEKMANEAEVTFNPALENYGGGSAKVQGLVAQIVYTFTAIPGINKVRIKVGAKETVVLGGEGYVIDRPLTREDIKL